MHTATIVSQVMQCCLPLMHAARWRALRDVAASSVNGRALSLVALAVGMPRTTNMRHRVKCVDRLLGNRHLDSHRFYLYAALARQWLTGLLQLLIVVDWSSLTADMQWHWLRASVVCDGRSITLYEEVHPRRHLGSLAMHARFIKRLAQLVGEAAKAKQLQLQLTSTCRRDRAELSVMTLAKRVIDSPTLLRKLKDPWPCRHELRSQVSAAINRAMAE